jgi:hypothetical protein
MRALHQSRLGNFTLDLERYAMVDGNSSCLAENARRVWEWRVPR